MLTERCGARRRGPRGARGSDMNRPIAMGVATIAAYVRDHPGCVSGDACDVLGARPERWLPHVRHAVKTGRIRAVGRGRAARLWAL